MKFVITSAQEGAEVHSKFLESLLNYCKINKAKLLVIPIDSKKNTTIPTNYRDQEIIKMREKGLGQRKIAKLLGITRDTVRYYLRIIEKNGNKARDREKIIDNSELSEYFVDSDMKLNDNIKISTMKLNPTASDPLSGLARFTENSTIFASPKLSLKPIPTSNYKFPKVIMTTGSVTFPLYAHNRSGEIAYQDHTFSAIVVEIVNNKMYHYRQLECNTKGEFSDLFMKYSPKACVKNPAQAIILGDLHNGEQCPLVEKATLEIRKLGQPEYLIYHDVMNSYSINHHHQNDIIINAKKTESNKNSLEKELEDLVNYFGSINSRKNIKKSKMIVVASNHDEAVSRYLKEGRFIQDSTNLRISLQLALHMLDGMNPIEAYFNKISKKRVENIKFLDIDEDFILSGVQLGKHGNLGSNGGRGSIKSSEIGSKRAIIGHSHSPQIWHKIFQVGTSTKLKLEYNRGYSSWLNSHCVLYDDGTRQLLNIVDGKWKK